MPKLDNKNIQKLKLISNQLKQKPNMPLATYYKATSGGSVSLDTRVRIKAFLLTWWPMYQRLLRERDAQIAIITRAHKKQLKRIAQDRFCRASPKLLQLQLAEERRFYTRTLKRITARKLNG